MAHSDDPAWYSKHVAAQTARARVRLMPCTNCGAQSGEKCKGVRGQNRSAFHQERWELYRERRDVTVLN